MPHTTHDRLQRLVMLSASRDEVWSVIGDFGGIAGWHPYIERAEVFEMDDETHRHLTTTEGEHIAEKLLEEGPYYYRFAILDSPFPFVDYRSTLSCVEEKEGCHVYWSADFEPTDPSADEIVAGFYEAGLEALRERFG